MINLGYLNLKICGLIKYCNGIKKNEKFQQLCGLQDFKILKPRLEEVFIALAIRLLFKANTAYTS